MRSVSVNERRFRLAHRHGLVESQQKRQAFMIESSGISDDCAAWAKRIGKETRAALRQRGQAPARDLAEDVPELGETMT